MTIQEKINEHLAAIENLQRVNAELISRQNSVAQEVLRREGAIMALKEVQQEQEAATADAPEKAPDGDQSTS